MRVLTRSVVASLLALSAPILAQTYEPVLIPPQINGAPSTMTPLQLGDDSTAQIDLGFDFVYWGQTFTSAWVSSNGFVSFQSPNHLCCNGNPLEQSQRNTIYGFWTDLISGSNPYYTRGQGSILFGWYNTNEYGTGNQYTFEIGLKDDNSIQFNYGLMPSLTYHFATAGITGPNAGDNIQLFYGQNAQLLSNQSGLLNGSPPVAAVDCNVTPMDPSCPPEMIAPIDFVSTSPIVTIIDAATADAAADAAEIAAQSAPEPEQEITQVAAQEEETASESITEQVEEIIAAETAAMTTAAVAEAAPAERLSPEQVAALAANGPSQDAPSSDQVTALAASGPSQDGQGAMSQDAPVFSVVAGPTAQFTGSAVSSGFGLSIGSTSSFSSSQAFETGGSSSSSSPSSVANTLEVLNMSGGAMPSTSPSQGSEQQGGSSANPDAEKLEAMASVPGFSAYSQVALQDRPDFYAVRDIYRNRRIRDANFEMYRMTNVNNAKWQEMVDAQYQR